MTRNLTSSATKKHGYAAQKSYMVQEGRKSGIRLTFPTIFFPWLFKIRGNAVKLLLKCLYPNRWLSFRAASTTTHDLTFLQLHLLRRGASFLRGMDPLENKYEGEKKMKTKKRKETANYALITTNIG